MSSAIPYTPHTLRIHSAQRPHVLAVYGVATLGECPYDLHAKEPGSFQRQPEQREEHCQDPQVRDAEPGAGRLCILLSEGDHQVVLSRH